MSSTNKTTNYQLSQFLGTDKPAWLGDYNSDMQKIDAGIHSAQTAATGADGKATTNATSIGTLANLSTTEKSNLVGAVNEVNTAVGTAQGTANSAQLDATSALNKASKLEDQFAFTTTEFTTSQITTSNFSNKIGYMNVSINEDASLFKVYGNLEGDAVAGQRASIKLSIAALTVDAEYYIYNGGFYSNPSNFVDTYYMTIKNGEIEIWFDATANGHYRIHALPILFINKDFGDLPN